MDGMDVFNFAIRVVPRSVKTLAKECGVEVDDIDYLVFHQSNKFMTDFFVKKLKFPPERVPYCIQKYGNTSSASIPLTICDAYGERNEDEEDKARLLMCGYGIGLSWGVIDTQIDKKDILPIIVTDDYYTEGGVSHD